MPAQMVGDDGRCPLAYFIVLAVLFGVLFLLKKLTTAG
jgi:hypothetical protein